MSKQDDARDAVLDALKYAAGEIVNPDNMHPEAWSRVAANLGQAYVALDSPLPQTPPSAADMR